LEPKYQSNSHKSKEKAQTEVATVEKKVDKPVTNKASLKKKGAAKKFSDIFVQEDARSVGEYILMDVAVPLLKELCFDIISKGASMFFFGDRGRSSSRSTSERYGYGRGYTNYNRMSDRRERQPAPRSKPAYSYDDIWLETRGEAEAVLDRMDELLNDYGQVSIGDLYDLVDVTGSFTDYKYGWTDLRTAEAVRSGGGYVLKFPRAIALD
jgi:hypothetical protein